jgi:geranyl-CoA carboxylase alpha subunit
LPRFSKLLVANRGEIACRVLRTAHAMGYQSVAVFSEADRDAPHVRLADQAVCIGGAAASESYLSVAAILAAARQTGADAIHPGYGFLSENAEFARACAEAGIVFVGPPADAILAMGDKARAKQRMREAGVPTVPGFWGEASLEQLAAEAARIGFPLLVKATAGGGGRGIRLVEQAGELEAALSSARAEALSSFGDGSLMLERFIPQGRHIEIQIFADEHGNAVHLGERDCSTQRRRQKVIEEAPAPGVDVALRERMGNDAVRAALAVGYRGAGTIELIVDREQNYYFLEMNTRLQVEHPVTELVTGLDLVRLQLEIASGLPIPFAQSDVRLTGHAIEARLYAEDPYAGFRPQTGRVLRFPAQRARTEFGVRVDAGIEQGSLITPHYDAMVAKLIAHGATREEAARKLSRALAASPMYGVANNARFLIDVLESPEFGQGAMHTGLLDAWHQAGHALLQQKQPSAEAWVVAAALRCSAGYELRSGSVRSFDLRLVWQDQERSLRVSAEAGALSVQLDGTSHGIRLLARTEHELIYALGSGVQGKLDYLVRDQSVHLAIGGCVFVFEEPQALRSERRDADPGRVLSPLAGKLIAVRVVVGARVQKGEALALIEAMKMETKVLAAADGVVKALLRNTGDQVEAGECLLELEDTEQT